MELLIKRVSLEVGVSFRLLETAEAHIIGRIRDVSKATWPCKEAGEFQMRNSGD